VNNIPVFIASDPNGRNVRRQNLPHCDDIKAQMGATILHRALGIFSQAA
jgi:myo-inositol-1-phosphate synthase